MAKIKPVFSHMGIFLAHLAVWLIGGAQEHIPSTILVTLTALSVPRYLLQSLGTVRAAR